MSRKHTIPFIELEIGENLYIQIKDVSFIPSKPGYISGPPEDCYEDEPAECDWLKENAKLVIKKYEKVYSQILQKNLRQVSSEKEFDVDDSFVYEYYEQIIEACEEELK